MLWASAGRSGDGLPTYHERGDGCHAVRMTTPFPSDLEIGREATLQPIAEVAASAGIAAKHLEPYGT